MSFNTGYRIYNGVHDTGSRRRNKGLSKKKRRMLRAHSADGWERKRAGRLAPQFYPSKRELTNQLRQQGLRLC